MSTATSPLHEALLDSAARHGERPALLLGAEAVTYASTFAAAQGIAATLVGHQPSDGSPFVAFVGSRSVSAYHHLLGILLAGRAYLPLEPEQPAARLVGYLDRAEVSCLLVESASLPLVAEICRASTRPLTVVVTDLSTAEVRAADLGDGHAVLGSDLLSPAADYVPAVLAPSDPLYMLFTSGSTGVPKAVVISHGNISALLAAIGGVLDLGPQDVVAQLFKLSFDPSALNILSSWSAGAALAVPTPEMGVLDEARLISRHGVTMWASVPSRTTLMRRMRQLKPDAYPTLRYVIQGGEVLTSDLAVAWTNAAPRARVLNQYGPTEATICVTQYAWEPAGSPGESSEGRVPIGRPLPGVVPAIVDDALNDVADGEAGELLVGGPQVCQGYWRDPERTAEAFVTLAGRPGTYYRTGDLVRRASPDAPLHFVGRADQQIKVLGRRIELGEVEAIARHALQVQEAAAVGWPETAGGYDGIELFVVARAGRDGGIDRDALASRLPPEAIPRHVHYVDELPLSGNGKYDRKALRRMLDGSAG